MLLLLVSIAICIFMMKTHMFMVRLLLWFAGSLKRDQSNRTLSHFARFIVILSINKGESIFFTYADELFIYLKSSRQRILNFIINQCESQKVQKTVQEERNNLVQEMSEKKASLDEKIQWICYKQYVLSKGVSHKTLYDPRLQDNFNDIIHILEGNLSKYHSTLQRAIIRKNEKLQAQLNSAARREVVQRIVKQYRSAVSKYKLNETKLRLKKFFDVLGNALIIFNREPVEMEMEIDDHSDISYVNELAFLYNSAEKIKDLKCSEENQETCTELIQLIYKKVSVYSQSLENFNVFLTALVYMQSKCPSKSFFPILSMVKLPHLKEKVSNELIDQLYYNINILLWHGLVREKKGRTLVRKKLKG